MFKTVDVIVRMLPLYMPSEFMDNEQYFNILLRNMTPETMQYILYNIKVQNYSLIDKIFLNILRKSVEQPLVMQMNLWKIIHVHNLKNFNLKQDIGRWIAFITSDFKPDSKINIFWTESITLLDSYYKELQKSKKVKELCESVVALFESQNTSHSYIMMLSHAIDFLPTAIIKKILIEINKQIQSGNNFDLLML